MPHTVDRDFNLNAFVALIMGAAFKLLLVPAYHSTDFDVHRNWMAVTHNLPITQWYFDATSQWTLDYPPFFAWFEWCLSWPALWIEPAMLVLQAEPYTSTAVVIFQRVSVMAGDVLYWSSLVALCKAVHGLGVSNGNGNGVDKMKNAAYVFLLAFFVPALLLVDHIHFQYNGLLIGVCLWSIWLLRGRGRGSPSQSQSVGAVALVAVMVNSKHLFISTLPAFAVFVLKLYCVRDSDGGLHTRRIAVYVSTVAAVFALAYGPFVVGHGFEHGIDQLQQIFSRLFPFERGLMHSYWAPNVWALYTVADKALGLAFAPGARTSSSHGLVGEEYRTAVLPAITPRITMALAVVLLTPLMAVLWRRLRLRLRLRRGSIPAATATATANANLVLLIRAIQLCNMTFFMVSWHVHEKASILSVVLMAILAGQSRLDAHIAFVAAGASGYSVFPLILGHAEAPVRMAVLATYMACMMLWMRGCVWVPSRKLKLVFVEAAFVVGLAVTHLAANYVAPRRLPHLPFLPLLLTSFYCAVCMLYVYFQSYTGFVSYNVA